ncbi:hydroxyacid dehydrogenase [Nocardia jinanensis]|uniref:Hydroxyacid dehydrogenase n=1 Tax=Nocardia jinanensis TaxID=382504 RepID=A0A917VRA2_9NOCA|nr:hydroxyacid dehydrogenase [Nocardia jinanensis]
MQQPTGNDSEPDLLRHPDPSSTSEIDSGAVRSPIGPGRVLQMPGLEPDLAATLSADYAAATLDVDFASTVDSTADRLADTAEVVVTSGRIGFDMRLLEAFPRVGAIISYGAGYDTIDAVDAAARGVVVSNTPDVGECVADAAVGLAIDAMRGLSAADRSIRRGEWTTAIPIRVGRRLSGCRVGIVGLGRIGHAVARRLTAFGCEISYHNRRQLADSPFRYHSSVQSLASSVDLLILTATGGTADGPLVGPEELAALGPRGFLVNVGRGSLVDENSLVKSLHSGSIGGAALDVFATEPDVPAGLLNADNVVLAPHLGSTTEETLTAMSRSVLGNLESFLSGRGLISPVPESLRTREVDRTGTINRGGPSTDPIPDDTRWPRP